jgi:hypothetical protein
MFPANFAATPGATPDPDPVLGHSGPRLWRQLGDVGEVYPQFSQLAATAWAGLHGTAIFPHYFPEQMTNYGDETQRERIRQILERNYWLTIIGMENNTALEVKGRSMKVVGYPNAKAYMMYMNQSQNSALSYRPDRGISFKPRILGWLHG